MLKSVRDEYPLPFYSRPILIICAAIFLLCNARFGIFPSSVMTMFGSLVFGFLLLLISADWLVDAGEKIGRAFGISQLVIGLTIIALGTSAPEFFVNVAASLRDQPGIILGNIFGSNIVNICAGIGISAIIVKLGIGHSTRKFELPFLLLSTVLLLLLGLAQKYLAGSPEMGLGATGGCILLVFFFAYIVYVYIYLTRGKNEESEADDRPPLTFGFMAPNVVKLLLSMLVLYISGDIVVESSVTAARLFGIREAVIGATVVAFGTSVPDITASIIAAKKGKSDIAVGNIIGSNLFNTLWVLGVSALISSSTLQFTEGLKVDLAFMAILSFMLCIIAFVKKSIRRINGVVFLGIYVGYISYLVLSSI